MATYIHCEACKNRMTANAARFNELYESLEGTALRDMFCDGACTDGNNGGPTPIKAGDICFAAVLLNNRSHFNYEKQRPQVWASQFIKVTNP